MAERMLESQHVHQPIYTEETAGRRTFTWLMCYIGASYWVICNNNQTVMLNVSLLHDLSHYVMCPLQRNVLQIHSSALLVRVLT